MRLSLLAILISASIFIHNAQSYSNPSTEEPQKVIIQTKTVIEGKVTAYTSDPTETDDTPFLTASQTQVRDGVIANNCLPFGTEVEIAGNTYVVEDRMNRRYGCEWFDIWMAEKQDALEWGVKNITIEVLK